MSIGILGAGHMGRTLAGLLVEAGYRVRLANSRGPASLESTIEALGPNASAATSKEMVASADIVVLATQWQQVAGAVEAAGPWDGKIVIDTTNNRTGPSREDVIDLGDRTSSEVVAGMMPGARIVKAFNHLPISHLPELFGREPAEQNALFVAGDDKDAEALVMQLIRDIGGEPIDTGGLREGGRFYSTGGPLTGRRVTPDEARRRLAEVSSGEGG